jgi:hypothetical protein
MGHDVYGLTANKKVQPPSIAGNRPWRPIDRDQVRSFKLVRKSELALRNSLAAAHKTNMIKAPTAM